jgi:hypothetical protein
LAGEWASTRSATTNPGVGGERVKFDSKDIALTAVFAALYVIVNVVQMLSIGNPTVYGPVQLRIADCLIALAALFGLPVVLGVTFGCFLSNAYYFLGVQDVLLGPIVETASLFGLCLWGYSNRAYCRSLSSDILLVSFSARRSQLFAASSRHDRKFNDQQSDNDCWNWILAARRVKPTKCPEAFEVLRIESRC